MKRLFLALIILSSALLAQTPVAKFTPEGSFLKIQLSSTYWKYAVGDTSIVKPKADSAIYADTAFFAWISDSAWTALNACSLGGLAPTAYLRSDAQDSAFSPIVFISWDKGLAAIRDSFKIKDSLLAYDIGGLVYLHADSATFGHATATFDRKGRLTTIRANLDTIIPKVVHLATGDDSIILNRTTSSNTVLRWNTVWNSVRLFATDEWPLAGYSGEFGSIGMAPSPDDWEGSGWWVNYYNGDRDAEISWGPVVHLHGNLSTGEGWILGSATKHIDTVYFDTAVLDSLRARSGILYTKALTLDTVLAKDVPATPPTYDSLKFEQTSDVVNGPYPYGGDCYQWARTSEQKHSGSYSAGLPTATGGTHDSSLVIRKTCVPGDTFSVWCYSTSTFGDYRYLEYASGGVWHRTEDQLEFYTPNVWTRCTRVISAAADSFRLLNDNDSRTDGKIFIDDVAIVHPGLPGTTGWIVVGDSLQLLKALTSPRATVDSAFINIATIDSTSAQFGSFTTLYSGSGNSSSSKSSTHSFLNTVNGTIVEVDTSATRQLMLNSLSGGITTNSSDQSGNAVISSVSGSVAYTSNSVTIGGTSPQITYSRNSLVLGGEGLSLLPASRFNPAGNFALGGYQNTNRGRLYTGILGGYRCFIDTMAANAMVLGGDQDSIITDAYNDDQWILGGVGNKSYNSHTSGIAGGGQGYLHISPYSFNACGKYDTTYESRYSFNITGIANKVAYGDTSGSLGGSHNYVSGYMAYQIGGLLDSVKGNHSLALPGYRCRIDSAWSMTFGYRAIANRSASIIFNLDTTKACSTDTYGQFKINAPGGISLPQGMDIDAGTGGIYVKTFADTVLYNADGSGRLIIKCPGQVDSTIWDFEESGTTINPPWYNTPTADGWFRNIPGGGGMELHDGAHSGLKCLGAATIGAYPPDTLKLLVTSTSPQDSIALWGCGSEDNRFDYLYMYVDGVKTDSTIIGDFGEPWVRRSMCIKKSGAVNIGFVITIGQDGFQLLDDVTHKKALMPTGKIVLSSPDSGGFAIRRTVHADTLKGTHLNTFGEMYFHDDSTNTIAIGTVNADQAITHLDTIGCFAQIRGFTFVKGVVGSIVQYNDSGDDSTSCKCGVAHGLSDGDIITLDATTNYNGTFRVRVEDATNFKIDTTYVADDAAGNWRRGSYLKADAGSGGVYRASFNTSGDAVSNNKRVKMSLRVNKASCNKTISERIFAVGGDLGQNAASSLISLLEGDRVWLSLRNRTDNTDFVLWHGNVNLSRVQ